MLLKNNTNISLLPVSSYLSNYIVPDIKINVNTFFEFFYFFCIPRKHIVKINKNY